MRFGLVAGILAISSHGLMDRFFRLGGRRKVLAFGATGVALLAVACGGGDDSGEPASSATTPEPSAAPTAAPQMFDAQGNPLTEPADGEAVERSPDAVELKLTTFNHGDFSLEDVAGDAVVINFWFPSCPPCRAELPDLQAGYQEYKDRGVQFVGIQLLGLDSAEEGAEFLEDLSITYPNGADTQSQFIRDFKVTGFPTTIFLDRQHEVSKKWTGILSEGSLKSEIESALEQ